MRLSESSAFPHFSAKACGVNVAMATMLPAARLPGYVPRGVRSRGRLRGLPHRRVYKSGTTGILQPVLASSIIFYVARVAVMYPLAREGVL